MTFLERRAEFLYYDDVWRIRAQLQNFQTIDTSIDAGERPVLARAARSRRTACGPVDTATSNSPLVERGDQFPARGRADRRAARCVAGAALVERAARAISSSPRSAIISPSTICRTPTSGDPSTPTRTLPYASLDTGLIFERDAGSQGQRTQTLEPRLVYTYVPYRNQDELPIFDTGLPDFNLVELFRTNRYVGDDRIGDANQLALRPDHALVRRVDRQRNTCRRPSARFAISSCRGCSLPERDHPDAAAARRCRRCPARPANRSVILPGCEPARPLPGPDACCHGPAGNRRRPIQASDIVTRDLGDRLQELERQPRLPVESLHLDRPTNPRFWSSTARTRPRWSISATASRTDILKQYDGSFAWPIAEPLEHRRPLGLFAPGPPNDRASGRIRVQKLLLAGPGVQRRYLSTNTTGGAGLDTSIALQLELTGLSSVGKPSDSFLRREIQRLLDARSRTSEQHVPADRGY